MQYIEAPDNSLSKYPSVFLAGGITGCPDWQSRLCSLLKDADVTVYNPRRKFFPIGDPSIAEEQIHWEFVRLRTADLVSFWFSKATINPIVLFELGAALERDEQPLLIGIEHGYVREADVLIQTKLRRPNLYKLPDTYMDVDYLAIWIRNILCSGAEHLKYVREKHIYG